MTKSLKSKGRGTSRGSKPRKLAVKIKPGPKKGAAPASRLIDRGIRALGGWRGRMLAEVRRLIREADPDIVEDCKWVKPGNPLGVPVWSHGGIVCTGETYAKVVKLTFAKGASLPDPSRLFNSSLGGNTRRAIDIHEGEKLNASAFKKLIQAAVAENGALPPVKAAKKATPMALQTRPVKLLSGGNPQIARGDGDGPVRAYIDAMPGWKRGIGRRLDALIERSVPNVCKAVKWNSPFYGIEGQGWFLGIHCFTKYMKVAFFRGAALRPIPPGKSKSRDTRYLDIHEDDALDEAQLADWVKQAAGLPGWVP